MDINGAIEVLEKGIYNPSEGLPDELFAFVSKIIPLVNVDLLVKNERDETLLTWRDDGFWTPGWHIPGGIIRFREPVSNRIREVARLEFGAEVNFDPAPIDFNECIAENRDIRGHFISLLYRCELLTEPDESMMCKDDLPQPNQWKWHLICPEDIIKVHEMYRKYI